MARKKSQEQYIAKLRGMMDDRAEYEQAINFAEYKKFVKKVEAQEFEEAHEAKQEFFDMGWASTGLRTLCNHWLTACEQV